MNCKEKILKSLLSEKLIKNFIMIIKINLCLFAQITFSSVLLLLQILCCVLILFLIPFKICSIIVCCVFSSDNFNAPICILYEALFFLMSAFSLIFCSFVIILRMALVVKNYPPGLFTLSLFIELYMFYQLQPVLCK